MMQVTSDQWLSWLSLYFWPLLRVLALISTAPILSERSVPKRVKLGLAMMITFAIAPSLPANDVPVFSFFALWLAVQQILIGIALGFTMQFAFAAVRTAGEIIGLQMGLSFATFVDPASHLNIASVLKRGTEHNDNEVKNPANNRISFLSRRCAGWFNFAHLQPPFRSSELQRVLLSTCLLFRLSFLQL